LINAKNFILCEGYIDGLFEKNHVVATAHFTSGIDWIAEGSFEFGNFNLEIYCEGDFYSFKGNVDEGFELLTHSGDLSDYKVIKK